MSAVAVNIKLDQNKGISNIDYNYLNLPKRISFFNGTFVRYVYTASGQRIRKEHHDDTKIDYILAVVGVFFTNNEVSSTNGSDFLLSF